MQPGIVLLASLTGLPIYPIGFGFSRALCAKSWDRFAAPLPLTTITGVVGEALYIPSDIARDARESERLRVETRLLDMAELAERWAARIRTGDSVPPTREQIYAGSVAPLRRIA